jgi:hypothetical protein
MSCAFYWAHNDGMSGHVWLSEGDLRALVDEMLVQGMPWPLERLAGDSSIAADEVESIVEAAEARPKVLPDEKLWLDWLRFLEGAAANGGLLVRP